MKNKETLERRRQASQNIPIDWEKRLRSSIIQPGDKAWNPIVKCFQPIEMMNIGRKVSDFYCVIFTKKNAS